MRYEITVSPSAMEDLRRRAEVPDALGIQLENDPRFLGRTEKARQELREGRGIRLEDLED